MPASLPSAPAPLPPAPAGGGLFSGVRAAFAIGRVRWSMLGLVFLATTLNYVDRAALGIMQPVLSAAMHWTAQDYADINFWFQVGYAIGYILQGRLIDRIGVKWAFAGAVVVWSVAAAGHGLATSVAGFMIARFFLGLSEAGNYPSCVKTTRLWFPARERAMAAGIFNAGTNVGAMMTPLLVPMLLSVWGWQSTFFLIGAVGLLWAVAWVRRYHDPEQHPTVTAAERQYIEQDQEPTVAPMSMLQVLRLRATWAYALANALAAPVFWFYLYWLPPYLNKTFGLGISVTKMGLPLIVIYLAADVGSIAGGWLSSRMISSGMRAIPARMGSMLVCALLIAPIVFASGADSVWEAVAYLSLAIAAHQAWTANVWSLAMDTSAKSAVSSVFGFGGMCGAIGGMFMTQLVGWVLTTTNNDYRVLFTMIPCAYAIALVWVFFVAPRKIETPKGA